MEKKSSFVMVTRIFITTTTLLLILAMGTFAQNNTSYDENTVPIGGTFSTALGRGALNDNMGDLNTAIGYQALYQNTNGNYNTAIGYKTLYFNTIGVYNTASGLQALYSNTTGTFNTAVGNVALYSNTTGDLNTAIGYQALQYNTTGNYNTANGHGTLYSNTTGTFNTASGDGALNENTTGNYNAVYGSQALLYNNTGNNNVAIGDSAGNKSIGSGNIYIGKRAGCYETGDNKLYIGNDSNKTIIYGDMSTGQLLLGNQQPTVYTFKGTRTLNVLGGILSDSVRVSPGANWADYVFANGYQLKPLGELENFIKINQHLPNVPSAADVANNGIELGAMNAKLLEKIEELTLYILQQQKQLQAQQDNGALLRKQFADQQQQIDELRKLLVKSK
jgi:hypothetical protein